MHLFPLRSCLRRSFVLTLLSPLFCLVTPRVLAETQTWTAGSGSQFNWEDVANWSLGVPTLADDVVFGRPVPNPGFLTNPQTIVLGEGSEAGSLWIRENYSFTGGSLQLGVGGLRVDRGYLLQLDSVLTGSDGFSLTGGGAVRLTSSANSYSGITSISNGALVIGHPGALGVSNSAVLINGSATRGAGGGSLVLDAVGGSLTLVRDLVVQGLGPTTDRNVALIGVGNTTLTGTIQYGAGNVATGLNSVAGLMKLEGSLFAQGTGNLRFGTVNSVGVGGYQVSGWLYGSTGNIEKIGGGTLILDPVNSAAFSGNILVNGGSVRVSHGSALGLSTANAAITLGSAVGVFEVRTDAPNSFSSGRMQMNTSGNATLLLDHGVGSQLINQNVTFGPLTLTAGSTTRTLTITGRNGYGATYVGDSVGGSIGGSNTIVFNTSGGISFTGNFWNNTSTTARTLTLTSNLGSRVVIEGSVIASGAAHILAKSGEGTLTILGGESTYTGATTINAGTLAISHFGSVNNNTATINIGATSVTGTLNIIGHDLTIGQATTSKVINLAGTTGGAVILANQTGSSPGLLFNANVTAGGAGIKTLTLGGTNTSDNTIAGVIPNNSGTNLTSLVKTGSGTWVLTAANTYTGTTLINDGTLRIQDTFSGGSRNVLGNSNAVGFSQAAATVGTAGGTLEYLGAAGQASSEDLGALQPVAGAGTVRVTPGSGGTATLRFASIDAASRANGGGTLNFEPAAGGSVVIGSVPEVGLLNSYSYFKGADFAYAPSTTDAVLRAPVYGVDAGFVTASGVLSANSHNLVTGGTTSEATTVLSLKIDGTNDPAVHQTGLLKVRSGATGGILVTGGSATLSGTGVTTDGSADLIIRVDGELDVFRLNAPVTSATAGGLTKTGAGTLIIGALNAHTGSTNLLEGTIQLASNSRLAGSNVALVMRQGTVLDLNGVSTYYSATSAGIGSLNGAGTITSSSDEPVLLAVGGGSSTGTGTFNGSILETNGRISVIKLGTSNTQTWRGLSNYTGSTSIGVPGTATSGNLNVFYLANIGEDSSIGRGDGSSLEANQGSLIFGGTTGGLIYVGETSVSTDRLFTLAGGGATISNNANSATATNSTTALIFSNTGPIAFNSTANQILQLGGTSEADNWFHPQILDNPNNSAITSLTKIGTGQWILGNSANSYSGNTTVTEGILQAVDGATLPSSSGLVLGGSTSQSSVFQSSGLFTRPLGTGPGTVSWSTGLTTGGSGFAASTDKLTVAIGGLDSPTKLVWGQGQFLPAGTGTGTALVLNSITALAEVEIVNDIDLNGLPRRIVVNENTSTFTDYATLSGVISNGLSDIPSGITKSGNGTLQLLGANTYNGVTAVTAGTLIVNSLGNSEIGGPSNLGMASAEDTAALTLGNATTTPGILQYVGPGEVSDRMIRLNTTTGTTQIHADGTGPLILTNLLNDMAEGAKTLSLRGSNSMGNMITSDLTNMGGNLAVTIDGGATWILAGNNSHSGNTTIAGGALGIGNNSAIGNGTLVLSSGSVFAYGDDRTIANSVTFNTNTSTAFLGEHSLTLNGPVSISGTASTTSSLTYTTTNNISADKVLTINGDITSGVGAARTWSINGSGTTVFNGTISSTTAFAVHISYAGNGTLILNSVNNSSSETSKSNLTINNAAARVYFGTDNVVGGGRLILTTGTLFSTGGDRTISNDVTHGGTFIIDGADKFTFSGTWLNNAGNRTLTVNTTGGVELAGEVRLSEHATSARTMTINGTGDVLISGVVSNGIGTGASNLSYTGTGTLTLGGANTFTGNTTLNNTNGTLRLIGAGKLGANNLTVNAGTLFIQGAADQQVQLLTIGGGAVGSSAAIDIAAGRTLKVTGVTFSATNNNLLATIGGEGTLDLGASGITFTIGSSTQTELDLALAVGTVTGSGTFVKAGAGTLDLRDVGSFNYNADAYRLDGGAVLGLDTSDANLILNGGVFQGSGLFNRALGDGVNQVQWAAGTGGGGFAAFDGPLTVTLSGAPDMLVWGGTAFFVSDGAPLVFGSPSATDVVTFTHSVNLNGAIRTVNAIDNPASPDDKAILSGNLTNGGLTKLGNGTLELSGNNNFNNTVAVNAGRLQFSSTANLSGATALNLAGGTLEHIGANASVVAAPISIATAASFILNEGAGLLTLEGGATLTTTLNLGGSGPISVTGNILNSGSTRTLNVIGTGGVTFANINLSESATSARTMNLNVAAGSTAIVNGVVSNGTGTGASNLTKQGEGHLILNGINTHSGALIVQNGRVTMNETNTGSGLQLGGGPTGSSAELVLNGANFNVNNSVYYLNANNPLTAQVNGTGSVRLNATRTFEIRPSLNASLAETPTPELVFNVPIVDGNAVAGITKTRNGVLVFAADNSYTGTTSINEGGIRLDYSTHTGSKIGSASTLSLTGGFLELMGHSSTAVSQSIGALTVGAGFNRIIVDARAGAGVLFNVTGTLTSTAAGRSIDFTLQGDDAAIRATGTGWSTSNGILGGWATYNLSTFATIDGNGYIVPVVADAKDNPATWGTFENIRDLAGFSGSAGDNTRINSLAFQAASSSQLSLDGVLDIVSGGILVTPTVGANSAGIDGGLLVTTGNQLFIHQHNTEAPFIIASAIGGSSSLTKNGRGELILDSSNSFYSGITRINQGTLVVRGGNAIGDTSAVTLEPAVGALLRLEADERIGTLNGGGLDGGNVDIGTHTLTLNNFASSTFSGTISGSGNLIKEGSGTLTLNTIASPNFTGNLIINQGQVTLGNRTIANFSNIGSVTLNAGTLLLDLNGGTEAPDKIRNAAPLTMINTGGIDGLRAHHDRNDVSKNETIGATTLLGGANTITVNASSASGTTQRNMTITTASLTRLNQSTLLVRGHNLGTLLTAAPLAPIHTGRVIVTAAPTLVGGAGLAGTTSISILPWAIGSESVTSWGDSFVTYAAAATSNLAVGFRPLNLETEYEQLTAAGGVTIANNVRLSVDGIRRLNGADKAMNALLLQTVPGVPLGLDGDGGSLHVQSGAFLFTGDQGITVEGFRGITTGNVSQPSEYIFHVVNSSAGGVTLNSPLTTPGASFTKSGNGLLVLAATGSTYSGPTVVNQGALQIDSLDKLGDNGSGGIVLNAGTLRFGGVFDASLSGITLGVGATSLVQTTTGGIFDTNGFNIVFANSIGNGGNGGLTKTGLGTLTLNAPANYRGLTTVNGGALVLGVANALPTGTNLSMGTATLDLGGHDATFGNLTLNGNGTIVSSGNLELTGTLLNSAATRILTLNGGGTTTISGIIQLAESTSARTLNLTVNDGGLVRLTGSVNTGPATTGTLIKTGNGTLELVNRNYFTTFTINNGLVQMRETVGTQPVSAALNMGGGPAGSAPTLELEAGVTLIPTTITFSATNNNLTAVIRGEGTLDLGSNGFTANIANSTQAEADMSWEVDTVIGSGLFNKTGAGTLDIRGVSNFLYNATAYQLTAGAILGLDTTANLILSGGVFEASGTFTRGLGSGNNQVQWAATGGGGFSAATGGLVVTLAGAPDPLVWGGTASFVPAGVPLIFGSSTADGVVEFTHNINLNGADRTVNVVDNTFSTQDRALLSGNLSDGSLTKTGNGILELSGANTLSSITINGSGGSVAFSNLDNLGGASIALQAGFLSFAGSSNLTVTNTINGTTGTASQTAGVRNLAANGTNGATVTFNSLINMGANTLTLAGSGSGVISGGMTQSDNTPADLVIASGNWKLTGAGITINDDLLINGGTLTIEGITVTVNDDVIATGAGTIFNLNGTGVLSATTPTSTSSNLYSRNGALININASDVFNGLDAIVAGDSGAGAIGTIDLHGNSLTGITLTVGGFGDGLEGSIIGSGTITLTSTTTDYAQGFRFFRGTVSANLAGGSSMRKLGAGTVVLSGDNSGLVGTVANTRVDAGKLVLDYTTSNTTKLSTGRLVDMRGGTLRLEGNTNEATTQVVNGLTLNAGGSAIELAHGGSQSLTFDVGTITRNTNGALNLTASANSFLKTSLSDRDYLGGWAVVNNRFAAVSDGLVTAVASVAKDDLASWVAGDNLVDSSGYFGTVGSLTIANLIFESANASTVTLEDGAVLTLSNGGLLVLPGAGPAAITGGSLGSGLKVGTTNVLNFVLHQQNTDADFTLSSTLDRSSTFTKVGPGTLVIDGNNNANSRAFYIGDGTVRALGGNALGDFSAISLSVSSGVNAILDLSDVTERIGGLSGGAADAPGFGAVLLGSTGTLINDQRASASFNGLMSGGPGTTIIKNGPGTWSTNSPRTEFTGKVIINGGGIRLDGNTSGADVFSLVSSFAINGPGSHLISDQDQSSAMNLIANTTPISLTSTAPQITVAAAYGLIVVNSGSSNATFTETVGPVTLQAGHNGMFVNTNGVDNASRIVGLTMAGFTRQNHATALIAGQNLGAAAGPTGRMLVTGATLDSLGAVGGAGADGTTTVSIIPYLFGESIATGVTEANAYLAQGNNFVTYTAATGFRPLDLQTEYVQNAAGYNALNGVTAENVRFTVDPGVLLTGGSKTINSLLIDTNGGMLVIGGASSDVLTIASGAVLATTAVPTNVAGLSGFKELRTGTGEYLMYVTHPDQSLVVSVPLTSAASLTKSGAGTLVLQEISTYNGGTWFNQGLIEVFNLSATNGATFDPSASNRRLNFGPGGAVFDTNGNDVVVTGPIGNGGVGGLTKLGNGTLTLANSGVAQFSGGITVAGGTTTSSALVLGAAGALPVDTDLNLGIHSALGGYFNHGGFETTLRGLRVDASSVIGGSANLTFTGNVEVHGSASRSLTINNTGVTTFDGDMWLIVDRGTTARTLTLAGSGSTVIHNEITDGTAAGSLTITNSGTTTLTARNTHTGTTTINVTAAGKVIISDSQSLGLGTALTLASGTLMGDGSGTKIIQQNVTNSTGTIIIGGEDRFVFNGTWLTSGGTRTVQADNTGGIEINGTVTLGETTNNRTQVFSGSSDITINGVIQNNAGAASPVGNLTKNGTGTLRITAANTYSGTTTVNTGTLLVLNTSGSATGSGVLTVAAAATLGGNGIIAPAANNNITINGRLQIGSADDTSAEKLTLSTTGTGLVTVNGVVAFDLFGGQNTGVLNAQTGNNDQLVVKGANGFTIGAGATLHVTTSLPIDESWAPGTEWQLFDWSGLSGNVNGSFSNLSTASPFNYINLPDLSSIGMMWDVSKLYTHGTIMVVVPEPGRMLLVFLGLAGLCLRRRR
jgi:fibronectin-binding autotransporter adhesin